VSSVFAAYARYYNLLYRDKDYAAEAAYVVERLRDHGVVAGARILELGSGTGGHAEHLVRMGFTVHGVDSSAEMIERAQARRAALPSDLAARLTFELGDVRTVRTGAVYDAVISLFHVMSYQTANTDLRAAFATAATHLGPGGLFFFDFWYGPAVLTERPEVRVRRLEDEAVQVVRVAEPVLQVNDNLVDVNFTVLVMDKESKRTERIEERHSMRYLFLPELEQYMQGAFLWGAAHAWLTKRPPQITDWSACVCLVRDGS
jgi:SAM-dependent methyltransferase